VINAFTCQVNPGFASVRLNSSSFGKQPRARLQWGGHILGAMPFKKQSQPVKPVMHNSPLPGNLQTNLLLER